MLPSDRRGGWIQGFTGTGTGCQVWPFDVRPEDIRIAQVAHALSLQCRFGGNVTAFYSVAQHSVLVSRAVEDAFIHSIVQDAPHPAYLPIIRALGGIDTAARAEHEIRGAHAHDGGEGPCIDMPTPIKVQPELAAYREALCRSDAAVGVAFGLPPGYDSTAVVKAADAALLATERRDLMEAPPIAWTSGAEPLPARIVPWSPRRAELAFLERVVQFWEGRVRDEALEAIDRLDLSTEPDWYTATDAAHATWVTFDQDGRRMTCGRCDAAQTVPPRMEVYLVTAIRSAFAARHLTCASSPR